MLKSFKGNTIVVGIEYIFFKLKDENKRIKKVYQ